MQLVLSYLSIIKRAAPASPKEHSLNTGELLEKALGAEEATLGDTAIFLFYKSDHRIHSISRVLTQVSCQYAAMLRHR